MEATPSITGMSNLNSSYDPDIDTVLDLDQADYTPLSTPHTAVPSLSHQTSSSSSNFGGSTQQTFSGPSFQYDLHRQQTGLPVGGLANTFALNQASGLQYHSSHGGFVMPTETLNIPLSNLDDFDFARHPSLDMSEMDFDVDSPSEVGNMLYSNGGSSQSFVTPTTLVTSNNSNTVTTPVQRIYPGMHSQQAAQAKALQAQKQQEMMKQQQQQQQQQPTRQIPGQKPLPKNQLAKDPLVEESISRLLSQMRQNTATANSADEESTPTNSASNMVRIKKDEDEMDDDERLLASEEGKKLSSKERRQLRNKVSARAFRSRRKEYIGQLEGEIATKVKEANDLRVENRQLREENTRLTDLTRMLLSSQAFSGFLQELSQSGGTIPNIQQASHQQAQATPQSQPQPQPQPTRKDVNPHDAARQMQMQQPQIGMALMPETNFDMSVFETPSWNSLLASNDYQVYAVTALPEPPCLDIATMSEKPNKLTPTTISSIKDMPTLPPSPVVTKTESTEVAAVDESVDLDHSTFSLYFDSDITTTRNSINNPALTLSAKPYSIHIVTTSVLSTEECGNWESLSLLCKGMEETSKRLGELMPRMT